MPSGQVMPRTEAHADAPVQCCIPAGMSSSGRGQISRFLTGPVVIVPPVQEAGVGAAAADDPDSARGSAAAVRLRRQTAPRPVPHWRRHQRVLRSAGAS